MFFFLFVKLQRMIKKTDIDEITSCLKYHYSIGGNQTAFIQSYKGAHSIEEKFKGLKAMSKYIEKGENMSLKNNPFFGGWLSHASRRYKYIKKKNLP